MFDQMNSPIDIAALEELEKKSREKPDICGDDPYAGGVPNKARYRMELYAVAPRLLSELKELRETERIAVKALEKIKDGGVPFGVLSNVEELMLAMCNIAREALVAIREKK